MTLSTTAQDEYRIAVADLARRLDEAPFGTKSALKRAFCETYGRSLNTLHRDLKSVGWTSGRKRRSDAGSTSQDEAALRDLAAAARVSVRKNGKATLRTPNARSMLSQNGREFSVSNARLNQLLKQRGMDLATQQQPSAHVTMRSLHPNHVHQVDPSLCLLYYAPNGEQHVLHDDEIYKNKPQWVDKIGNLKCWRYVLTDHYSSAITVRYFQSRGETQENLFDFLLYAWGRREGRVQHGVPRMLYTDPGSANTASAIKNALTAMDVIFEPHMPGNPRAKGQVENANNIVETLFESRLRFEPVRSIDELNAAVEAWAIAYNANAIPDYDSRLKRTFMRQPLARAAIWQQIRKEHLRILPSVDVCRWMLTADAVERIVKADRRITFRHPVSKRSETYPLDHIPEIYPRLKVMVSPLVYGDREIIVTLTTYQGEEKTYICQPIEIADPVAGFAVGPVFGEDYQQAPDSVIDKAGKELDRAAFGDLSADELDKAKKKDATPFGGLDAHSHLSGVYVPDFMSRQGTELTVPDRATTTEKPLSRTAALVQLARKLNRDLEPDEREAFLAAHGDEIFSADIDNWLQQPQRKQPALSIVS